MQTHCQDRAQKGQDDVPKRVDPDERRAAIAEAVYQVIGDHGWDAVTLRDVASTAGVSMGQVQHYFATKTDMLLFALAHMRARVLARLQRQLETLPQPVTLRDQIHATIGVMLPVDEPGRQEAAVNIAFFSAATVNPEYARLLYDGYARQLGFGRAQFAAAAADGKPTRQILELAETLSALERDQHTLAAAAGGQAVSFEGDGEALSRRHVTAS